MLKECKIVMLPTKEAQNCIIETCNTLIFKSQYQTQSYLTHKKEKSYHLYVLSNEPIKTGDVIFIHTWYEQYKKGIRNTLPILTVEDNKTQTLIQNSKKVIATTDPTLDLPTIPSSFIEEYCEKGGIDKQSLLEITGCLDRIEKIIKT